MMQEVPEKVETVNNPPNPKQLLGVLLFFRIFTHCGLIFTAMHLDGSSTIMAGSRESSKMFFVQDNTIIMP